MRLSVQVRRRAGQDRDVLSRAADHGVAQMAEQATHLARPVVVIHLELRLRLPAEGAFAVLLLDHLGVAFECDAVFLL